jgi:hypothetical protein
LDVVLCYPKNGPKSDAIIEGCRFGIGLHGFLASAERNWKSWAGEPRFGTCNNAGYFAGKSKCQ